MSALVPAIGIPATGFRALVPYSGWRQRGACALRAALQLPPIQRWKDSQAVRWAGRKDCFNRRRGLRSIRVAKVQIRRRPAGSELRCISELLQGSQQHTNFGGRGSCLEAMARASALHLRQFEMHSKQESGLLLQGLRMDSMRNHQMEQTAYLRKGTQC